MSKISQGTIFNRLSQNYKYSVVNVKMNSDNLYYTFDKNDYEPIKDFFYKLYFNIYGVSKYSVEALNDMKMLLDKKPQQLRDCFAKHFDYSERVYMKFNCLYDYNMVNLLLLEEYERCLKMTEK